ncbi:MAG: LON peptidase substrate-binding domain-containing protein [Burkholderiaceae bacterium]|nr:LON peptidase substrate-binding domain-containing protein [Burkholderiaceae bacterium]
MTPAPLLTSLPLFPLGALLFPDGRLALRVFEVRYLDMVRKCHQAGTPFGVVGLTQGHEVRQAGAPEEQFTEVGTLAVIERLENPQPSLLLLQCRGGQRFRTTERRRLPHGLWVADAEVLAHDPPVPLPEDLRALARRLEQVLAQVQQQDPDKPAPGPPSAAQLGDCGWVANRWCEWLPVSIDLKQQLLALDNPLLRLELVGDILEQWG